MKNNKIRVTESQLHQVIKESVKKVLNEIGDTPKGQYMLGKLSTKHEEPYSGNGMKGKMRKEKDIYPIFNYADKAAKKNKLSDSDFQHGYKHQTTLNRFNNEEDPEKYVGIAGARGFVGGSFLKHKEDPLFPLGMGHYTKSLSVC